MATATLDGLHHVTAICGDPRANHRFYTGMLGLRLVKKTVNFDDPGTYHLYYGDGVGSPGSILTFFPWVGAPVGRQGTGQAIATAFLTGTESLDWWIRRLKENAVQVSAPLERFGERYVEFRDPDGLGLEIVSRPGTLPASSSWTNAPVPPEHALRGFHTVTLSEDGHEATHRVVADQMGFRALGQEKGRFRYQAPGAAAASYVDVLSRPAGRPGSLGRGTVHHIAFRVANDLAQAAWRDALLRYGHNVSPVMDRSYFHSIYYREPGGVLFEIATNNPGFATDEAAGSLGEKLMLPAQYESRRTQIERELPAL